MGEIARFRKNGDRHGVDFDVPVRYNIFNSMRDVEGQRKWTAADHALADEISTYYANFVKMGNPNGEGLTEWAKGTREDGIPFMWWHDGTSECVTGRLF